MQPMYPEDFDFAPQRPMPNLPMQNNAAKRFALQRALQSFAGGLAAPPQGGFFGGLASGLSGSLGAGMQYDQRQHEQERQRIKDEGEAAQVEESRRRWDASFGQDTNQLNETIRHNKVTEQPKPSGGPDFSPRPYWLDPTLTPEQRMTGQRMDEKPDRPKDERIVQIAGPDGTAIWVRESQAVGKRAAQAARSVTGLERSALAYYNRAKAAVDQITTPTKNGVSLEESMASQGLPGQAQLRYAPNMVQTPEQQMYRQAQRAFTEARLRRESGAAIPMHEIQNDSRTYFAQPGDSPKTIEAKRKARQVVIDGLKFSSGRAYDEYYGGPAGGSGPYGETAPTGDVEYVRDASGKLVPK